MFRVYLFIFFFDGKFQESYAILLDKPLKYSVILLYKLGIKEILYDQPINMLYRISSPVTSLAWLRGFHEVKVPRFHDNGTGRW